MLRLRISPSVLSMEGPNRELESTRAVLGLTVDRGKVGICSVGETEDELVARLGKELDTVSPARNVVASQLLAAGARRDAPKPPDTPKIRLVRPGEDAWWDRKITDAYSLRSGDHRRSLDPREVLVVEPLRAETWSPHLLRGLLVYVCWSSTWTRRRTFPAFLRPKVELLIDDAIEGVDRQEVVDTVRHLWGTTRVLLPEGETVEPLPLTRLKAGYAVTRVLWWCSAIVMLVSAHPEPGATAVLAGVVAAAALFTSRVLGARLEAERPRRTPLAPPQR